MTSRNLPGSLPEEGLDLLVTSEHSFPGTLPHGVERGRVQKASQIVSIAATQ